MFDPTDPRHFTPEQRLEELTVLLATGVLRLPSVRPNPVSDSTPNGLDVSPQSLPHASRPVNASREQRRS